jgi:hypothetical protein
VARILACLLAIVAVLPTAAWARLGEVCAEADRCCCRRDDDAARTDIARMQAPDCCEAPCSTDVPAGSAAPLRAGALVAIVVSAQLPADFDAGLRPHVVEPPSARPRGPPPRWFARVRHRLI